MATADRTATIKNEKLTQARVASGINLLLGLWSMISPWVFNYAEATDGATWSSLVVGFLITVNAGLRLLDPRESTGPARVNIIWGAWTALTPWIYDFTADAGHFWNSILSGVAVIALALWSANCTHGTRHATHT